MATEVKYFANVPSGHGPNQYAWCRMSVHGHGGSASLTIANIDVIHGNSTRTHYRADGIVFADGTLQTTAASHGGGGHGSGSYNQSLNTTDVPTFAGLILPNGSINLHGGSINFYNAAHGITFSDGSSLTSAAGLNGLPAPQGNGGALLYSVAGHGWQQTHGWMQVGPTAAHGGGGAHSANILVSTDGATRTYYQSNGIRFADGTFQSTASHGSSPYQTSIGQNSIVPVGALAVHGTYATVAGGASNTANGAFSFIGSGFNNLIEGLCSHSSIAGGSSNTISGGSSNTHIIGSNLVAHGISNFTLVNNFWINNGGLIVNNIPTTDPLVVGKVWSDSGTLKISAGI